MRSLLALTLFLATAQSLAAPKEYFAICVIDEATGRGVPLVALQTTSKAKYYTDSNGYVAFHEPGLMSQDVWFSVSSPGYEFPHESFGFRGTVLKAVPGKEAQIKVRRTQIAERIYRSTGQGIYRDTILLGKKPPIEEGALSCMVTGQDSAHAIPYKGELFWIWGDTSRLQHPLSNFFVTAARVKLPGKGGLDPSGGINFDYFKDERSGFTKEMARITKETTPVWLDSLLVVKNDQGKDQLMARFVRAGPNLTIVDQGLVLYDDAKQLFEHYKTFPL